MIYSKNLLTSHSRDVTTKKVQKQMRPDFFYRSLETFCFGWFEQLSSPVGRQVMTGQIRATIVALLSANGKVFWASLQRFFERLVDS